ncbi:hypothetical protein GCM10007913_12100 [Devosia yakushimensis]|uniref:Uncharacterized protein n=1 Tax=Devosia yakushimensis TaxID=470028 RepID=A0ABQ5UBD5_9HYPH|nr:hypothetical protein [Devosia yakushimensis]GLQ09278.1 hypothetical protein GCM10007913_12100 [Devosia yakushimensis]
MPEHFDPLIVSAPQRRIDERPSEAIKRPDPPLHWVHRVETIGVEITVDHRWRQAPPHVHIHQAARALAERLVDHCSVQFIRQPEDPLMRAAHQWCISVVMPDDGRNYFADQLASAREDGFRAGISAAAARLKQAAANYANSSAPQGRLLAFNVEALAGDVAGITPPKVERPE